MSTINSHTTSQITVFILIGAIAIVSVIFIILSSSAQQQNIIDKITQETKSETLQGNQILQTQEYCLELAGKKAIILASLRGGLIYPNSEFIELTQPLDISSTISSQYARNLNLDYSNLQKYMHSGLSSQNYLSKITTQNVSQELSHYVLREFVRCQFENITTPSNSQLGYTVLKKDSHFKINSTHHYTFSHINISQNTSLNILLQSGESISIPHQNITLPLNPSLLQNSPSFKSSKKFNLDEEHIIVLENSTTLDIDFQKNAITFFFTTHNTYQNQNSQLDISKVTITIDTPFYSLFKNSQKIMNKKMFNRSLNFSDTNLYEEANLDVELKIKEYDLTRTNEKISSIIQFSDLRSPTFFPHFFVLYSNTAPLLSKDEFIITLNGQINLAENSNYLKGKISHNEYEDSFLHSYNFNSFQDSNVKLSSSGILDILTTTGSFSRTFYIHDTELLTPFTLKFNLDSALNEDNSQVDSCFTITYSLSDINSNYNSKYDDINTYISETIRKVQLYSTPTPSNYDWQGFISSGKQSSVDVTITANDNCFTNKDTFDIDLPYTFPLEHSQSTEFSIQAFDLEGSKKGTAFEFTLSGVDCLGPQKVSTSQGAGSCCNMDEINTLILDREFDTLEEGNFILSNNELGYKDEQNYLCVENPRANSLDDWSSSTHLSTKKVPTSIEIMCQGNSPILEENKITTTGDTFLDTYTLKGTPTNVDVYYTLEELTSNTVYPHCQECRIPSLDESGFILNNGDQKISVTVNSLQKPSQDFFIQEIIRNENTINDNNELICQEVTYDEMCLNGQKAKVEKLRTEILCE